MKAKAYVRGKDVELDIVDQLTGVSVEVELDDGRTAQFYIEEDGEINLRGYGNKPMKMGNSCSLSLRTYLAFEEPIA